MKNVMIVEDDESIRDLLRKTMSSEYKLIEVDTGKKALEELPKSAIDLIILDLMLPDISGYEICSALKSDERLKDIPIIVLSSKSGPQARITAYQLGASNYVEKPYDSGELQAIVRAILHRSDKSLGKNINIGDLEIDLLGQRVIFEGQSIPLTSSEFRILCYLAQREGEVVNRERLLNVLGGPENDVTDRVIDTHISSLRKKIKGSELQIKAIYREGYGLKKGL